MTTIKLLSSSVFITVIVLIVSNNVELSSGAKILSIQFMSSKSHYMTYEPLLMALAERGHEVTIANAIKSTKPVKNVRRIQTFDSVGAMSSASPVIYHKKEISTWLTEFLNCPYLDYFETFYRTCEESYKLEEIQKLRKEKFDLIVFAPLWNDCVYGLIHEFNTTTILYNQMAIMHWVSSSFGTPSLPSFIPMVYYSFPDDMTFLERVGNFIGVVYFNLVRSYFYEPKMEELYRKYLSNPNIPGIQEIQKNASLALVNSNLNFVGPRPLTPDVIEVGGLYLRDGKPLPKDLQDFCDGAGSDGVIVFTLGSILEAKSMPVNIRDIFVNVFSKLKQRVIWKFEDTIPNLPANIKLSNWLPQQDVLLHPNTRLFITHGGHGSTSESLFAGVPMVGIPMFGEQQWNIEQAVIKGYAVSLNFPEITEKSLADAINAVLYEPKYSEKATFASRLYRDQKETPLERAVYWIEYVLRYNGAPHLKSVSRDLTFSQYYSLDVVSFLVGIALLILLLILFTLRSLFRCVFRMKTQGKNRQLSTNTKKRN